MISQEHLTQFKKIYAEDYGKKLDDQVALAIAVRALNLARIVRAGLFKKANY